MSKRFIAAFCTPLILLLFMVACGPSGASPAPALTAQLQWLGQSTFLVTSSQGTKILIDPTSASTGYVIAPIAGVDAVLVSHEHADHSNVGLATGSPLILRGLTPTGWNTIDEKIKDFRIYSISPANPIYHDNQQGSQRGRNTVFVLEVDGLRVVHLGDLGHTLTPETVKSIGSADVLMVPVGGVYTVDAVGATEVLGQLKPRVAIPMHYKTPRMSANWLGAGVEPFLEGKVVERLNGNMVKLSRQSLPVQTTILVLNYE